MVTVHDSLAWLLPSPANFRALAKTLSTSDEPSLTALRELAATSMDVGQLGILGRALPFILSKLRNHPFADVSVGVVGTHTTDFLVQTLAATGLRHGISLALVGAEYGQVVQSLMDEHSQLRAAKPEFVYVSLDAAGLGLDAPRWNDGDSQNAVIAALNHVRSIRDLIRDQVKATPVLHTLAPPAGSVFGSFDRRVVGTPRAMIARFNRLLLEEVLDTTDLIVDVEAVATDFGLLSWYDERGWYNAKLPVSLDAMPLYAEHICRVIAAARGKARKCLVLDLDNTLWGGVIGDDGVAGLALGQGSGVGESHLALQRLALDMRSRGIILAVCSKNEDATARLPFLEHPEMILRESHFAAFVANWSDKASNLRQIASALNIGIDALVFLDDNPAEREIVRAELPEVAVPEIGEDPSDYASLLARAGYFEGVAFSGEDVRRADLYAENAARIVEMASTSDIASYLSSLDMHLTATSFDGIGRSRITQLINKSNQFNLTTKRYTEQDVAHVEHDENYLSLQVRLADRFGDNGMISVLIFIKHPDVWTCDTWLMSCRVLGRRVEESVLGIVARLAKSEGVGTLRGIYIPTSKNGMVARHFEKLGFGLVATHADGRTEWELPLADYWSEDVPIQLHLSPNLLAAQA